MLMAASKSFLVSRSMQAMHSFWLWKYTAERALTLTVPHVMYEREWSLIQCVSCTAPQCESPFNACSSWHHVPANCAVTSAKMQLFSFFFPLEMEVTAQAVVTQIANILLWPWYLGLVRQFSGSVRHSLLTPIPAHLVTSYWSLQATSCRKVLLARHLLLHQEAGSLRFHFPSSLPHYHAIRFRRWTCHRNRLSGMPNTLVATFAIWSHCKI